MVLFLFIIMLLDVDKTARVAVPNDKRAAGVATLAVLVSTAVWFVTHSGLPLEPVAVTSAGTADAPIAHAENARDFGLGLFTKYMLPIQLAGFLLLSAMIGVVSLSKRPKDAA